LSEPSVRLESFGRGDHCQSFRFTDCLSEIVAWEPYEVRAALRAVEAATHRGQHAAGFVSYEAAAGLDAALKVKPASSGLPLVWFGVFATRESVDPADESDSESTTDLGWDPSVTRAKYNADLEAIRAYIEAGDTYQVNHTFRMTSDFDGDPWPLYRALCRSQKADYCAYVDTGKVQVLSASPELFFAKQGGRLTTRPMKGTHRRGRWSGEDEQFALDLLGSEKNRAENLMIVDLLRNDLGRVSKTGSVEVTDLWEVESYETLFQMTSTVQSEVEEGAGIPQLFEALFPCGSVTGAPKVRTMEIISEIEADPRGVYTGSIGYVSPGGEAMFNVAIRTVCVDRERHRATFGVGGGITWDSTSDDEYQECVTKARVLTERRPAFSLFETVRYDPKEGVYLLDRHLDRLMRSARYFGFRYDAAQVTAALENETGSLDVSSRIRITLDEDGKVSCQSGALSRQPCYTATVSPVKVNASDVFLYHKTTNRSVYDICRAACPDVDDVILVNERGELTEFTIGNLVLEIEGQRVTPTLSSGLLAGTFREELFARSELTESVLTVEDLQRAENVYMINSVRDWVPVTMVRAPETRGAVQETLTIGS
jgi:para-aminobenzoate synthetase / 4-amino-4-deoxychorismate lyase